MFDDGLTSRDMMRAIEALSQQNNRAMSDMEQRRMREQMRGRMPGFASGFGDDSDRKRLKLTMDGWEVFIQTMVPRGLPVSEVANQFARHTHELLRNFPQGWSRTGEGGSDNRVVENEESEESGQDNDRFGAAFE